ncbi:LPS export ABC transporter permease LptF [Laribacter hongkongensis]|uniref:LPS export ABC transporter permease LptF n=1 Tax=Laribacter hongkongensis TaxID=168471 RepID=UPI001EFCF12F|nr:LPS export ABC transporter permease LptF [Laribacter hongkongensis]MCG9082051.1 LPS export ABC transporter permease LptF [Laribacter hongkongensis]
MIFYRSVIRELTAVAFAVFSVLLAIMVVTQVVKLFDKAASGALPADAIVALIAFSTLGYFGTLLSITLFISVIVVLTRIWRDHEMAVWLTSGLSPNRWIRPVLACAVPLTLLIATVSLFLGPWAARKGSEYTDILRQQDEISAVAPGVFKESRDGSKVYFVENYSGEAGSATNLFVRSIENGKTSLVFAREGIVRTEPNGERYLYLTDGRRYEGEAGAADWKVVEFRTYKVKINQNIRTTVDTRTKSVPSSMLWLANTPDARAELAWRVSLPIASLILALLAIPLSYYNPRSGQTFNLLIAIFVYQLYYNLMGVVQSWISKSELSVWSMVWLHLAMLGLFVLLMVMRRKPLKVWWQALTGGSR